jgi:hypothetical protein
MNKRLAAILIILIFVILVIAVVGHIVVNPITTNLRMPGELDPTTYDFIDRCHGKIQDNLEDYEANCVSRDALIAYKAQVNSKVPFMGPISITVIDPLTKKGIPNLYIEYSYTIELPPIKGSMTSPPSKTSRTRYSTDQNGKVTIPQTAIDQHFYGANLGINADYYNSHFGSFSIHLPLRYYKANFPTSTVLHVTTDPQNLNVELVPNLSNTEACNAIATKNIRQCCILRIEKQNPSYVCESRADGFLDTP